MEWHELANLLFTLHVGMSGTTGMPSLAQRRLRLMWALTFAFAGLACPAETDASCIMSLLESQAVLWHLSWLRSPRIRSHEPGDMVLLASVDYSVALRRLVIPLSLEYELRAPRNGMWILSLSGAVMATLKK